MQHNKHIQHIENLPFINGMSGFDETFYHVSKFNEPNQKFTMSVKYDGKPSVVFGFDPSDGEFFIGLPSVFNKRGPKTMIKDVNDIDNQDETWDKEFKNMMKLLFFSLRSSLKVSSGVFQGDVLWYRDDLTLQCDESTRNVVSYTLNTSSEQFEDTKNSFFIMSVHTTYKNLENSKNIRDLQAFYEIDVQSVFNQPSDYIVFIDPYFEFEPQVKQHSVFLYENMKDHINWFASHKDEFDVFLDLTDKFTFIMYQNYVLRNSIDKGDFESFFDWYTTKHQAKLDTYKSEKGRESYKAFMQESLRKMIELKDVVTQSIEFTKNMSDIKLFLLSTLTEAESKLNNLLVPSILGKDGDTYETHEGFCVVSSDKEETFKIVDRELFSPLNFDKKDK